MNPIEAALHEFLTADATLIGLVGQSIFCGKPPQGPTASADPAAAAKATTPYVRFYRGGTERVRAQKGPTGLAKPSFVFEAVTEDDYDVSRAIADAVRNAFELFGRGLMGTNPGVEVRGIFEVDDEIDSEFEVEGSEEQLYATTIEFEVWHVEVVPV